MPAPILTAHLLRYALTCERRVWLDVHGDPSLREELPPEAKRRLELGILHEQRIQGATAPRVEPVPVASWEEGVSLTRALLAQGVPGLLGACLEQQTPLDLSERVFTVRGRVDRLVRLPDYSDPIYAPIEIKQRARPDPADWVQLDYYAWLLGFTQRTIPPGELWLGANEVGLPRERLPHTYDEERLMAALAQVLCLLDPAVEPPVILASHCRGCPWKRACEAVAHAAGSIDVLYALPRQTRDHLRRAGLDSLAEIAAAPLERLQQVRGIGSQTAVRLRANAQAWLDQAPVWHAALPAPCDQPGWMFDLETFESRGKTVPWCMGWCDTQGATQIAVVGSVQLPEMLALPDGQQVIVVPDSDSAWEVFAEHTAGDAPIFHWSGYDAAIMRGSARAGLVNALAPRFVDLHAAVKRSLSLPLRSTSIKQVAAFLGFDWGGFDDWLTAYLDYGVWLETGDPAPLARACAYQRADVQSMAHVWRWMQAHPPPD